MAAPVRIAVASIVEAMLSLVVSGCPAFSKWICYAPVDGDMLTNHWDVMIAQVPYMVYMSPKFGSAVCHRRRYGYADYVPLPVDMDQHFMLPLKERELLRHTCKQRVGWSVDTLTVLTVARNQWRKNYPEIIKAACHLKENYPERFSFVLHCCPVEMMGWDLPRLIKHYNVDSCVAISDQQLSADHKNQLYNSADLFLLPSLGEGFGIPIVEAALYELPIFTTDDTANKDLTELLGCSVNNLNFETSWQCGPTIPRPYVRADTIYSALVDYLRIGHMYDLDNARKEAESLFNVHRVSTKWEDILQKALAARGRSLGTNLSIGEGKLTV